jgi:hypothetical protein
VNVSSRVVVTCPLRNVYPDIAALSLKGQEI